MIIFIHTKIIVSVSNEISLDCSRSTAVEVFYGRNFASSQISPDINFMTVVDKITDFEDFPSRDQIDAY